MKPIHVAKLNGQSIAKWIGTEMALSDGVLGEGPICWEDSSVPYLQLVSIALELEDGSVFRMLSQLDDGGGRGHFGLYLITADVIDCLSSGEIGSSFRTRELSELPVGKARVEVTEAAGPNAVVRMEMVIGDQSISFWSAEVYERDGGYFEALGPDETILVQVDGMKPVTKKMTRLSSAS